MNAIVPLCVIAAFLAGLSIQQAGHKATVAAVRALEALFAATFLAIAVVIYWWPR